MIYIERKIRGLKILVLGLAFLGVFALGFGTAWSMGNGWIGDQLIAKQLGAGKPENVNFDLFWRTWNYVHNDYVGTIDDQQLVYGAVRGMVAGLDDPYSVFFDPAEAKRFTEDVEGKFYGIGIEIGIRNKSLTVIAPVDDTPAQKAGLRNGDVIVKIDDKETAEMTLPDAVSAIRGERGTTVKLTILPKDSSELKELLITRDLIHITSVKHEIKNSSIGYVRITQFSDDTTTLAEQALRDLKDKKVSGIVLDLRNNPGGYLQGAQEVASMFVSEGVVVSESGKNEKKRDLYTVGTAIMPSSPLIVLVNEGSASASEIVAGAIQDRARGRIVGEKTFGKGSVQNIKELPGGSSLKITIAEWFTPNGRQINKHGIEPDVVVAFSPEDEKENRDPQLDKALELLSQK